MISTPNFCHRNELLYSYHLPLLSLLLPRLPFSFLLPQLQLQQPPYHRNIFKISPLIQTLLHHVYCHIHNFSLYIFRVCAVLRSPLSQPSQNAHKIETRKTTKHSWNYGVKFPYLYIISLYNIQDTISKDSHNSLVSSIMSREPSQVL